MSNLGANRNLALNITRASVFPAPQDVDGSVIFVIDQLNFPQLETDRFYSVYVDLSSIPTLKLPTGNVLALLMCEPHISIQTRQVRATGNGNHTLVGKPQRSEGNIDFNQANYILSYILLRLSTDSGPTSNPTQVGTDMMVRLIFGTAADNTSHTISPPSDNEPPAPLTNITAMYKQVVQSAMKSVLSGAYAIENVTGGYTEEQMVLTASLGHIITSAILFVFLMIILVAAQFRKERAAFTLVNVAAALADSDVLQKSVDITLFRKGMGKGKVLKLVPTDDGRLKLYLSEH